MMSETSPRGIMAEWELATLAMIAKMIKVVTGEQSEDGNVFMTIPSIPFVIRAMMRRGPMRRKY